jgi:hypothetical protein
MGENMNDNNLTLYSITNEISALEKLLEMDEGEITPEYELLKKEVIDLLVSKTDSCCGWNDKLKDEIDLANKRIEILEDFINIRKKALERFSEYILSCLDQLNIESFDGMFRSIKKRKPVQVVEILDENKIPASFTRIETIVSIEKQRIKDALKNGEIVDGAILKDGKVSIIFGNKSIKTKKTKE